jgi:predicted aconitase with swiveling domain
MNTFTVQQATGSVVKAPVLVDAVPFSPRYDLDRVDGRFSRAGHPLYGRSLSGRILVCPAVQGGVAGGWAFLAMRGLGVGPTGLVFGNTNPVMVQGAVTADIPIMAGIDAAFFERISDGDIVRIDPAAKTVEIL